MTTKKTEQAPEPQPPHAEDYVAVSIRKDGRRYRAVLLNVAAGKVVGTVEGEPESRAAAIGHATLAMEHLHASPPISPYIPNSVTAGTW